MGILSALNPFTFGRKYRASWNALMAAYTFEQLDSTQKNKVMAKAVEIESSVRRRPVTLLEITATMNEAQRHHLFSLAMGNVGILPALGGEFWFPVTNPHSELINAEGVLQSTKHQLEQKYKVDFPSLSTN